MKLIYNIVKGWWNSFRTLPPNVKEFYDARLSVCKSNECEKLKFGICTACGCPVSKKTKVLAETCPENFWLPYVYNYGGYSFIRYSELPKWLVNIWHEYMPMYVKTEQLPFDAILLEDWEEFLQSEEAVIQSQ